MENLNAEQVKKALQCFHQRILDTHLADDIREGEMMAILDALALINLQEQRIKELAEKNERLSGEWINATEKLPDPDVIVLAAVTGTPKENIKLCSAYFLASYSREEGWILEGFEDWKTGIIVTHWCKVPAPPRIKT